MRTDLRLASEEGRRLEYLRRLAIAAERRGLCRREAEHFFIADLLTVGSAAGWTREETCGNWGAALTSAYGDEDSSVDRELDALRQAIVTEALSQPGVVVQGRFRP